MRSRSKREGPVTYQVEILISTHWGEATALPDSIEAAMSFWILRSSVSVEGNLL